MNYTFQIKSVKIWKEELKKGGGKMEVFLAVQSIYNLVDDVFFPRIRSILWPESKLGPKTEEDKAAVLKLCDCAFRHSRSLHCIGSDEILKLEYDESDQKRRVILKSCSFKNSVRGSRRDPEE